MSGALIVGDFRKIVDCMEFRKALNETGECGDFDCREGSLGFRKSLDAEGECGDY